MDFHDHIKLEALEAEDEALRMKPFVEVEALDAVEAELSSVLVPTDGFGTGNTAASTSVGRGAEPKLEIEIELGADGQISPDKSNNPLNHSMGQEPVSSSTSRENRKDKSKQLPPSPHVVDGRVAKVPRIVRFCYDEYRQGNIREGRCKICRVRVTDGNLTTSNFIRHIRFVHPDRYREYEEHVTEEKLESRQHSFSAAIASPCATKYGRKHSQHESINQSLVLDLVVGCGLSPNLVEKSGFRRFLEVLNQKYVIPESTHVTAELVRYTAEHEFKLRQELASVNSVSITLDIWTDKYMHGYLGISAHYLKATKLQSSLISFTQLNATAENIKAHYRSSVVKYGIEGKVIFIISDNTATMKAAFTVGFRCSDCLLPLPSIDNQDLWEENREMDDLAVTSGLHCFAHTLQLVVADGITQTAACNESLLKCYHLAHWLQRATNFRDIFEPEFRAARIPQEGTTRWHSLLLLVKVVLRLDAEKLDSVLTCAGKLELKLTAVDTQLLSQLVTVLDPFLQATAISQGEKVVAVSYVTPCVLLLCHHLKQCHLTCGLHTGMIMDLRHSLFRRFAGIFVGVGMANAPPDVRQPFSHEMYLQAPVLDPNFGYEWLHTHVEGGPVVRQAVEARITESILKKFQPEPSQYVAPSQVINQESVSAAAIDEHSLFSAFYKRRRVDAAVPGQEEFNHYIRLCGGLTSPVNAFEFWARHEANFPTLSKVALTTLIVPATSTPIERMFAHGGIAMDSLRSEMSNIDLSSLVFVKCNRSL